MAQVVFKTGLLCKPGRLQSSINTDSFSPSWVCGAGPGSCRAANTWLKSFFFKTGWCKPGAFFNHEVCSAGLGSCRAANHCSSRFVKQACCAGLASCSAATTSLSVFAKSIASMTSPTLVLFRIQFRVFELLTNRKPAIPHCHDDVASHSCFAFSFMCSSCMLSGNQQLVVLVMLCICGRACSC